MTEPQKTDVQLQAHVQQAIMAHPFFKGSAVLAFGLAGSAVKAVLKHQARCSAATGDAPQHGPFFHVTQEEKDTCEVCERQRLSGVGAQSSTVALREALAEALAVIADCVGYSHSGDPWEENAFDMGELDIHDYARDGRLERAKALLAAQPPATTAAVPGCAGSEGEPFMMLSCREAKQCLHNIPGCICDGDPTNG